jgi:two-component system sensor histidine kinase and response regulator WspE
MVNGKKRILIVDDSRAVRQLLKMVLQRHLDCDLVEAEDGQEAYEKLKAETYDVLITDINMPRMNGLSLIGRVRNDLNLRLPIVIVTTMGHEEDRDAGMNLGADTYITKPINGTHLIETVNGFIN